MQFIPTDGLPNYLAMQGAELLMKKALAHLKTMLTNRPAEFFDALEDDLRNLICSDEPAKKSIAAIDRLARDLAENVSDFHDVVTYWRSLPWSTAYGTDPRKPADAPREDPFGLLFRRKRAKQQLEAALAGGGVVGEPNTHFAPDKIASKRMEKASYCQDVRSVITPGVADIAWKVEGAPVLWLTAKDGSEVVLLQEDLRKIQSLFPIPAEPPEPMVFGGADAPAEGSI